MPNQENSPAQEERTPFYEDRELGIRFVKSPTDSPDGYDIFIRNNYICLPSRCLDDLAHQNSSTESVQRSLEALNPLIPHFLSINKISYEQMHIAFLKVRLLQEKEFNDAILAKGSFEDR